MKRFAFTMLELVFVIIVIGILAILAMPNFNRHPLQEAAEQVASHIRYTQHLAMVDNLYDPDPTDPRWYRSLWRIRFYQNGGSYYYTVFSDKDKNGNADYSVGKTEIAVDPLKHINMNVSNNNKDMNLADTYGIKTVTCSCDGVGNIDIFFDEKGRPYVDSLNVANRYTALLNNDCTITLVHNTDGNATITIRPETGYVSVTYP
jgi:Tfp pilus assembly protein FimT